MNCFPTTCCLLAALCFAFNPLNAQVNNFQPAYYIGHQGDTIPAMISQDGDLYLSKFIKVRNSKDGNTVEMRPVEISGFGFPEQNLHYQRVSHRYETKDREKIEVPRFARRLVAGHYDLYRLEQFAGEFVRELADVPSHTYYLKNEGGELFKLEQVEETVTGTRYRIIDRYKGGLKYLMEDWPEGKRQIEKLRFQDADLVEVLNHYNRLHAPQASDKQQSAFVSSRNTYHKIRAALAFANSGGEAMLENGFGGSYSYHLYDPRVSNSLTFGIGFEILRTNYGKRPIMGFVDDIGGEMVTAFNVPISADYYLSRVGNLKPKIKLLLAPSVTNIKGVILSRESVTLIDGSTITRRLLKESSRSKPVFYYGIGFGVELANIEVNLRADRSLFFDLDGGGDDLDGSIMLSLGVEYCLGKKD